MKILGEQFGVKLEPQSDGRTLFTLLSEDDDNWFEIEGSTAEVQWIDDLISVLQKAKEKK